MRQLLYSLVLSACIICTVTDGFAQQIDNDYRILFKSGEVTFPANVDEFIAQPSSINDANENYLYRLVQFTNIPSESIQNQLKFHGVELLEYIPNKAYIAAIPTTFNHDLLKVYGVRAVVEVPFNAKMDEYLANEVYPNWAVEGENLLLNIKYNRLTAYTDIVASLSNLGITVQDHFWRDQLISVVAPKSSSTIQALAKLSHINYIETAAPPAEPEQLIGNTIVRANVLQNIGYDGTGVRVQTRDNYDTGSHIDLEGRVNYISTNNFGTHGVGVAGIFSGAGNLVPDNIGAATGSDMYITDYVGNFQDTTYGLHLYDSIKVTNSSYGDGCNDGYTTRTQTVDNQIYNSPTLMHVFSTGNSGTQNCQYGAGSGWGNITGGHKIGKNVLSTGSVDSNGDIVASSSRGPSTDGRIKPDLVAQGANVTTMNPNNAYQTSSGTSFAAPSLAGVFAQLIHAYKDLNGGQEPESALIKAVLLNTATDLGNVGPDFIHGWGKVNGLKAYESLVNNQYFTANIAQGATNNHTITIPAGVEEARIMVYWMDPQGSLATASPLVNNLDMTVSSPGGTTSLPLILDPTPNPTALNTPAVQGVDNLNNMEQVRFTNPAAGNYTLNVTGTTVPNGAKSYYVLYEFLTDDITLTYPFGGEGFEPGETVRLQWDAHTGTNTFSIEASLDGGTTWNTLNNAVNADDRSYDWLVPNAATDNAKIRITRNSVVGTSNDFTVIGKSANITVDSACSNILHISWDAVPNATGYDFFLLGNKYMDSVGTTNTNSISIPTTDPFAEEWMAVRARYNNGTGQRTDAFHWTGGSYGCTYTDDLAINLLSPGTLFSCSSDSVVSVEINNVGYYSASNVFVHYQFNNNAVVTDTITGSIDSSLIYNFNTPLPVSSNFTDDLKVWVTYGNDVFNSNDTIDGKVGISTVYTLPYVNDFETFDLCATTINCEGTTCDLKDGWVNLSNGIYDDIDWRTNNGGTTSQNTGPSTDFNPGTAAGKYLYLEASSSTNGAGCVDAEAQLMSPCLDLTNASNPVMTLAYHMFGANMGSLHVDVYSEGQWDNDIMTPIQGDQGNNWSNLNVSLSNYAGEVIKIRIRGITGQGFTSDIAIDDFSVFDFSALPTANFTSNLSATCLNLPVTFSDNSSAFVTNWKWDFTPNTVTYLNGTTDSSQNPVIQFNGAGNYDVQLIATNLNGNDTIVKSSYVIVDNGAPLPFSDDFETFDLCGTATNCGAEVCLLSNNWVNETNGVDDGIDWRTNSGGTPSNGTGPSSDHTIGNASGKYLYLEASGGCTGEIANLLSPCIDLSNTINPQFSMWYHMNGANVGELRVDILSNGVWTNDVASIGGSQGNQWLELTLSLANYIGQSVTFRVRGITGSGWSSDIAIDDINVFDITTPPVAGMSVSNPACNDNATFSDNSTNGAATLDWDFGANATPQTAVGPGPHNVQFNSAADQTIQLIATSLAGSDTLIQTVTLDTLPIVDFTFNPANEVVTFSTTSTGNTYLWDFGDNTFSSSQNPGDHTYATSGSYDVTLTINNDCGSSSITKTIFVIVTDVDDLTNKWGVQVFPNPNQGQFTLQLDGVNGNVDVSLVDLAGKTIRNWNYANINDQWNTRINAGNLASGIYIVRVTTEDGVKNVKLLIE